MGKNRPRDSQTNNTCRFMQAHLLQNELCPMRHH